MSGLDDSMICGGVDKIPSDNKTCTSYAQKVEHCKKDGAGEIYAGCANNNMSNNTDDIGSVVSKELDSIKSSAAFTN